MKKTKIAGWKDVFTFTLVQTLKSKAFIISYVILLTLVLVSMPLINLLTADKTKEAGNTASPIKKVYVNNQTTLPDMDFSKLNEDESLKSIAFEKMNENYDTVSKRIENDENTSVILTISEDQGMYSLNFVKASNGSVNDSSLQYLSNAASEQFEQLRIETLGITQEQIDMLQAPVKSVVSMADVNGNPVMKVDTSISMTEYWFIYGILFVVLMVNMMASTQIATSIVTEKSTRVIEYLLTSVKPLALMIGKILAMLVAVLFQMGSMVIMVFLSNKITAAVLSSNGKDIISQYLPKNTFQNLNIVNIILCFILIALGMIFYATLAALAGATVSRIEEISEGLTLFTMTNLVGVYIGIGAAGTLMGAGENAFVNFAFLFPLSSPFVLPGAILIGKASLVMIIVAIVLQLLFILLLFQFVAKVFETLILHNGNRIKMSDVFKISKTA
ncbi:MAG TPA: ABC transporter permease [Mobilitalea sp.]|nr:ABC transporter permease [Mobilitalea sp.]